MISERITSGHDNTILVVEDETMLRHNICMLLEILNYDVLAAADGAEALLIYEQNSQRIRVVITDLLMPNMGGLELCQVLRQNGSQVHLIMMSGYSENINLNQIEALNVSAYFQKPMIPEDFIQVIARLLQQPTYADASNGSQGRTEATQSPMQ